MSSHWKFLVTMLVIAASGGVPVDPAGVSSPDGTWSSVGLLARRYPTAIYDPDGNRMVVLGGTTRCGAVPFDDVPVLSLTDDPAWSRLSPAGAAPATRSGFTAIHDATRGRILIFGGGSANYLHQDVWALSLDDSPSWTELSPSGVRPSPRARHAAIYDPLRDRMLIFGGYRSDTTSAGWMADVWELTFEGGPEWHEIVPGGAPPPATPSLAVYDPEADRMVVIGPSLACGGWGAPPCPADSVWGLRLAGPPVWEPLAAEGVGQRLTPSGFDVYDPVRNRVIMSGFLTLTLGDPPVWSTLPPSETWPPQVAGAGIFDPVGDRLMMFGGQTLIGWGSCGPIFDFDSTWVRPLSGFPNWTELTTVPPGSARERRSGHTSVYDSIRDRLLVFGGMGSHPEGGFPGGLMNDVWALPLGEATHRHPISPAGEPPSPRWGHTAIFDPLRDRLIVFGGDDGAPRNDAWALSMQGDPEWRTLLPAGGPPPPGPGYMSIYDPVGDRMVVTDGLDTWALTLAGVPAWSRISPLGPAPPARRRGSAVYDPVRRALLLFGGQNPSDRRVYDDLWALALGPTPGWTRLSPSGTPPSGRAGQAAIYDPVRDRMVIYGGGVSWDECVASLCSCSPEFGHDVWALELGADPAWQRLAPSGPGCNLEGDGVFGQPLSLPAIYDPVRDRMILSRDGTVSALVWGRPPRPAAVDIDPDPSPQMLPRLP